MTVDKTVEEFFKKNQPHIAMMLAWMNGYPKKATEKMVDDFLMDILERGYHDLSNCMLFALDHEKKDGGKE